MSNVRNSDAFQFLLADNAQAALSVIRCNIRNYAVSQNYRVSIEILAQKKLDISAVLGTKVCLCAVLFGRTRYLHGVLCEGEFNGASADGLYRYKLCYESPLCLLKERGNSRIYHHKTAVEIVTVLLQAIDWPAVQLEVKVKNKLMPIPCVVQFEENDLDFMQRVLSQAGLLFVFLQRAAYASLLISDDVSALAVDNPIEYFYDSTRAPAHANYYYDIITSSKLMVDHYILSNHAVQQPDVNLKVESVNAHYVLGYGVEHVYGDDYSSNSSGRFLANIYQAAVDVQREVLIVHAMCGLLQPGSLIKIVALFFRADESQYAGNYRVIDLELNYKGCFSVKLTVIPEQVQFHIRPLASNKFMHVMPAEVIAVINDGLYQLRFLFATTENDALSSPARLLQSGAELRFPLKIGAQVACGFENGDLLRPLILGVLPSEKQPSPVTNANCYENIIRSTNGTEVVLSDLADKESILLATAGRHNYIVLNSKYSNPKIVLKSERGDMLFLADKNINIYANKCMWYKTDYNFSINARQSYIMSSGGNVNFNVGNHFRLRSGRDICVQSMKGDIKILSENVSFKVSDYLQLSSGGHSDVILEADEGGIKLVADADLSVHSREGGVVIGTDCASIEVKQDGTVVLSGETIKLCAPMINLYEG